MSSFFIKACVAGAVLLAAVHSLSAQAAAGAINHVPTAAPRTTVLDGRRDAFRAYCTTGEGLKAFAKIKADFDKDYLRLPFPAEPLTYGDPDPKKRDSDKADKWRATQDACGLVSGVAEAATLIWLVTGEEKYLLQAKEFLVKASSWHFAPDWKSGPVPGATDILYNDEANFRLWRKLPLIYDQLRAQLTPAERKAILANFKQRGDRTVAWIKAADVEKIQRNSLDVDAESHPVRFMAMVGLSALALWDDLPEAREWWRFAYVFYRDQFSPWGGDDGGWAEGSAYWRGTIEHAAFQDALLAIGDPLAYATPFWKNSPYFALYNVQPYLHTTFGDTSNAGHFNLEPAIADYMEHLARVQQNGFFRAYAELCADKRPRPLDKGLANLDRNYPTACEFLVRNFIASAKPLPPAKSLSELPPDRFFRDVGWVSLHSALGRPEDDIQITFKSSPYGSFSHSHADQNAFILNAYGEGLAINSAYREFHRSPHHQQWTWQTKSKNDLLIDGLGQKAQDKSAAGRITRFETSPRFVWTTGDATAAYQSGQNEPGRVQRVTRDLVFVDQRYVILRDRVTLKTPGKLSWLLHAEKNLTWDGANNTAVIRGDKATLTTQLIAPGVTWRGGVTDEFPVPVDPKYASGQSGGSYVTGKWSNQSHLGAESATAAKDFAVFSVLWPERGTNKTVKLSATLDDDGVLTVVRPDGKIDRIVLTDETLKLGSKDAAGISAPVELQSKPLAAAPVNSTKTSSTKVTETTPVTLPDAETFIYRDGQPDPMRLHVVKPKGWSAKDRRPAMIYFFGGAWTRGTPEKSISWARLAAKWGMVGIAPDYRTSDRFGTTPVEAVADARAAMRWVQDHASELGIDPAQIVVGGGSAGGHLALWTGIEKAPFGSKPEESPSLKPAALILQSAAASSDPADWNNDPKLLQRFGEHIGDVSPLQHLDRKMPPVIMFHGDADKTVPYRIAVALHDRLVGGGNTCEFITVPGAGHGFSTEQPEWKEKSRALIKEFLTKEKILPVKGG